jgi:hypothetical protein
METVMICVGLLVIIGSLVGIGFFIVAMAKAATREKHG